MVRAQKQKTKFKSAANDQSERNYDSFRSETGIRTGKFDLNEIIQKWREKPERVELRWFSLQERLLARENCKFGFYFYPQIHISRVYTLDSFSMSGKTIYYYFWNIYFLIFSFYLLINTFTFIYNYIYCYIFY